jgi:hypothetical protein
VAWWPAATLSLRVSSGLASPVADAHERGKQAARSAVGGTLLGDYSIIFDDGQAEISVGATPRLTPTATTVRPAATRWSQTTVEARPPPSSIYTAPPR